MSLDVIARYVTPQDLPDCNMLPLVLYRTRIHDDWLDYNGHMNEAFSVFMVGYACDALAQSVGAMQEKDGSAGAMFTAETHVSYHSEVPRGAEVFITGRVLAVWPKRWQILFQIFLEGQDRPAVSVEQMSIYTEGGKVTNFPENAQQKLEDILQQHLTLPPSPYAGRKVGDPKVSI